MDINQITQRLNEQFSGDARKLVFWFDENAEFVEDIDGITLENAKIYKLEENGQLRAKYLLEREDTDTSYLIYAPFPKPPVEHNHLYDTIKYSKEFFADRASLICVDLGIQQELKPVIQRYIKFFAAKERTEKFYALELDKYSDKLIETAIMSVLCKCRTASFEEVVRAVVTERGLNGGKLMEEIDRYGLTEAFWTMCGEQFGYRDAEPTVKKLAISLFITYTSKYISCDVPAAWSDFVLYKSGSVIAFLDNIMNNVLYRERYDELSAQIAESVKAKEYLSQMDVDDIIDCDTFSVIDELIIAKITDMLAAENTSTALNRRLPPEICDERMKKHYGERYRNEYEMLFFAFNVVNNARFECAPQLKGIIDRYLVSDCLIDTAYRKFYMCYDALEDTRRYEKLRDLVENIYTHDYLSALCVGWNNALSQSENTTLIPSMRDFYGKYVVSVKERVVVIISDAMRYEVALDLWGLLSADEKCSADINVMMGMLPSVTKLGMAALLPNKNIEITSDNKVLVNGKNTDTTQQREEVLRDKIPNGRCYQYDDIASMKREELRKAFSGAQVTYIYHNQIDARGDKLNTENEVFKACAEAVDEVYKLIRRLTEEISAVRYVVTADHGFIYKRDKLQEHDKISSAVSKDAVLNKRYIISDSALDVQGTRSFKLSAILNNDDTRFVSVPSGIDIFKASGAGQNYVHGGSSPQEMLIPVISVRTQTGHKDTRPAAIALVSIVPKVTSLIVPLDFIQNEPVSDIVKAATYKLFFVSDSGEVISNECIYVADSKDRNSENRVFRLKFTLKDNKRYDVSRKYSLVAYDMSSDINEPAWSHDVIIDLAFVDDYQF